MPGGYGAGSPYGRRYWPFSIFPEENNEFQGLNLQARPDEVPPNGAVDLLNIEFDRPGAIRTRDGYQKVTASAGATRYDSICSLASTGTITTSSQKVPGTGADDASVGTVAWTNPGNIGASDNTYATATTSLGGGTTHYLKATNFGFALPAGATVTGISVEIERSAPTGGDVRDSSVKIVKAGAAAGTEHAAAGKYPATDSTVTYGSSSDLWGATWANTDINASTFGVALSAVATDAETIRVDFVRVTVYYVGANTSFLLAGASGSRIDAINADGTVAATVATASDTLSSYASIGTPGTTSTYIANSGATIRKYTGGAFSQPAGMPKAAYVAVQSPDNRLVAANVATIPTGAGSTASTSLVHFSGAGTPETWNANDYIYLTPGDGQDIQGLAVWHDLLFVFKANKYFVFYGNSTDSTGNPVFNYRRATSGVGLVAPNATAASPQGLYFVDRRGIYLAGGTGSTPVKISGPVDPLFIGGSSPIYLAGAINPTQMSNIALCWFSGRLYMSFAAGSSATNDHTLVYDPEAKVFTLWDIPMGALAADSASPSKLLFTYGTGTNDIGQYAPNAYPDDAGTTISGHYRSGFYAPYGYVTVETVIKETVLEGNGTVTFSLSKDQNIPSSGGGAQATVSLGSAEVGGQGRYRVAQKSNRYSWQVEGPGPWRVDSVTNHLTMPQPPGLHGS